MQTEGNSFGSLIEGGQGDLVVLGPMHLYPAHRQRGPGVRKELG